MTTFAARYSGRCAAECGRRIEAGDDVQYVEDELVHEACAEDPPSPRRESPICPSCWIAHAGECM